MKTHLSFHKLVPVIVRKRSVWKQTHNHTGNKLQPHSVGVSQKGGRFIFLSHALLLKLGLVIYFRSIIVMVVKIS